MLCNEHVGTIVADLETDMSDLFCGVCGEVRNPCTTCGCLWSDLSKYQDELRNIVQATTTMYVKGWA